MLVKRVKGTHVCNIPPYIEHYTDEVSREDDWDLWDLQPGWPAPPLSGRIALLSLSLSLPEYIYTLLRCQSCPPLCVITMHAALSGRLCTFRIWACDKRESTVGSMRELEYRNIREYDYPLLSLPRGLPNRIQAQATARTRFGDGPEERLLLARMSVLYKLGPLPFAPPSRWKSHGRSRHAVELNQHHLRLI